MESISQDTVLKLTQDLPFKSPLARLAMALLADPEGTGPNERLLLKALSRNSLRASRERDLAVYLLVHTPWSEEQRANITQTLSRIVLKDLDWFFGGPARLAGRGIVRALLLGGVTHYLTFAVGFIPDTWNTRAFCMMLALMVVAPLSYWQDTRLRLLLPPVLNALAEVGRPDGIAALAQATTNVELGSAADAALKRMVDRLRPEDYGTLPSETISALCQILRKPKTSSRTAQILLQALTILGDERAIPTVKRLANRSPYATIRDASAALLPILEKRALDSKSASQLLRAGVAPADESRDLLRAARDQSVTESSQLLRATPSTNGEEPI